MENQEREEFNSWVKTILLSICGNREAVVEKILSQTGNGVEDMAFKYNIIKAFENERVEGIVEGRAEGKAESILTLLEDLGTITEELHSKILSQTDHTILDQWLKAAARAKCMEEFERVIEN